MILVRVTFQAKFGKAGEIVNIFKNAPDQAPHGPWRLLTDLSGPFDTLVLESTVESIDEYFRELQAMFADSTFNENMRATYDLIASGHREFYTIEAEGGGTSG